MNKLIYYPLKVLGYLLGRDLLDYYYTKSYSQGGEDLVINSYLSSKNIGFYVDIGACHPKRYSNTHFYYKKGWSGINIDPTPGVMAIFNKQRPRDINLEIAVSNKKTNMLYYVFKEPAFNGFYLPKNWIENQNRGLNINKKVSVKTMTLKQILDKYLPHHTLIDLMTVDTEGMEMEVLKSNNWVKYRPTVIIVEQLNTSFQDVPNSSTTKYLQKQGYKVWTKTRDNIIFGRCDTSSI